MWRQYFYGIHMDVLTDCTSLQYVFQQKDLKFCHIIWLELLTDYAMIFIYHLDKANVMADSLSKLSMYSVPGIEDEKKELFRAHQRLDSVGVCLVDSEYCEVIVQDGLE